TGLVATSGGTGSGYGANVLIGSATTADYGGALRLTSPSALPAATTVAIGNGLLDIGPNNVTLGGLTFTGTNPGVAYVTDRQGVSGTGTLTVTGPIRALFSGGGWGNAINVPVDAGGGTLWPANPARARMSQPTVRKLTRAASPSKGLADAVPVH